MKMFRNNTGNSNAGCFNSKNLIYLFVFKSSGSFFSHLVKEFNIHLMVQKTVYLQHIPLFYNAISRDSFF